MNIYKKIQQVKRKLLTTNIKKSGYNPYAKFNYYELTDFVPYIVQFCDDIGLYTTFTFTPAEGILKIINIDKPDEIVECAMPMARAEIKGCNEVQLLGGTITYLKRYLYLNAFDIVESDLFDAQNFSEKEYRCETCKKKFEHQVNEDGSVLSAETQYKQLETKFGRAICQQCRRTK